MKNTVIGLVIILAASANAQWTVVNLHPASSGAVSSRALGVDGNQQVGWAEIVSGNRWASLWTGSAASWVSLHPAGPTESAAGAVKAGQQVGTTNGGSGRAGLWTGSAGSFVDLHPAGPSHSGATGVDGGQQVGYAFVTGNVHAAIWSGTAASFVDLHPAGAVESQCHAMDGGQQAGYARIGQQPHASLWSGTAASWVDLNPAVATQSIAFGAEAGQQGGTAFVNGVFHAGVWQGTAASWVNIHPAVSTESVVWGVHGGQQAGHATVGGVLRACLWSSSAASWVDLSSYLPAGFGDSQAMGISHVGALTYVVGYRVRNLTGRDEALMWVSRSVAPTSFSMFRGSVFSGNLASLQNSDDNRLVMRPGITLGTSQPPIQIILNATAPTASPDGFSFSLESSASFGNAQQKISLYNFTTGLYEELDARLAKTSDDTVTVTVRTNPSRFIEPGTLAIRALVSFRAVGPSLAFPWSGRIDKVWWNFPG